MKMRWVGGAAGQVMDTPYDFQRYGQLVEMPDALASRVIKELPLLSAKDFDSLSHTEQELKDYSRFETHGNATSNFLAKRGRAWGMVHNNHYGQPEPEPVVQATEVISAQR